MTIKELDQRLTLVLEDFSSEMRSEYDDYSNEPVMIMIVPLAFVAVFANITAFARVRHCYKAMKE